MAKKKIKDGTYIINLDECADVGTHWIALYVVNIEIIYFGSFGVEHVPEVLDKFFGHKSIKTNIFRIQSNNSIMCGYFCIGFIDFMLAGKTLIDFTSLLSPYDLKKISKLNSIETLISQTLIKIFKLVIVSL